jgi:hypothetical protein
MNATLRAGLTVAFLLQFRHTTAYELSCYLTLRTHFSRSDTTFNKLCKTLALLCKWEDEMRL